MAKGRILIAEDEEILANTLRKILSDQGFTASSCTRGEDYGRILEEAKPDLVLLDIYLGDVNGIQLLHTMRTEGWDIPVIVMTAHSDVSLAVRAMKEGAADFVVKPFDLNHLVVLVDRTLEHAQLQARVQMLQEELEEQRSRSGIIGRSAGIRRVMDTAEKLALGASTTVLIEGESGTGKELIARFIHHRSARSVRPFVTVNCGAIPKELAESEFFGHERGAFTGAGERTKQGKFELADGGTILLDEIGELSLGMQVKLLRVLEEKRFYRLGGTKEIGVDVRVIASSNRDLAREVEGGRFREDLFYRLNVASIKVPPLRSRREDIADLTHAFLTEYCSRFNRVTPELSPDAILYLERLPWKGNVRELRNAIERVVLLNNVSLLTSDHFAFLKAHGGHVGSPPAGKEFVLEIPPTGVPMNEVVRDLILKTLDANGGNRTSAARVLGISSRTLRNKLNEYRRAGLLPDNFKRPGGEAGS